MCGICGIALSDQRAPVDLARARAMCDVIAHRGPDGEGLHHWPGAALGHRRLAIIDVAGGAQPIANEDETVWVSFNGEIYNYLILREQLIGRGHVFRTRSDTEVIVHAYEEYGVDFVRRLNGIFAFAIYDTRSGRLLLARDHLGVKPLFYSVAPDGLYFGSEIKAVLAGTGRAPAIRRDALGEYLTFRYVTGSRTFFDEVFRLPAGHVALWDKGSLTVSSYWNLPQPDATARWSVADATEELHTRLETAVRSQLMSEVPLGTFCSGGCDSGLITGYAARHSDYRLHTFSVGFADPQWDETTLANDTAFRFGTDHHVLVAEPDTFQGTLRRLIWNFDEPLNHPNSIPIAQLSEFARRYVTVVLTGEGSDELFGGYPRYRIAAARQAIGEGGLSQILAAFATRLPGHRAALLSELMAQPPEQAMIFNSRYVSPELVSRLVGYRVEDTLSERAALLRGVSVPNDGVASIMRYELLTYLGALLDRVDRMSMASGLEARVPFLDVTLVEWALSLPSSLKVGYRTNKRIVKELGRRTLHRKITDGRKSGFGVPLGSWFRAKAFAGLIALLRDRDHPAAELFDGDLVARLLREHHLGTRDHGQILWLLTNVYLWHDVHVTAGRDAIGAPRTRLAV